MGPRAWLGSVVVLGLVLAPARGQTQLAWKWNVGDRFYLETVNTLTAITKADNQEVKGSLETTTVDQYKVAKSDATAIVLEKTLLAQRFKNTSSNGNEADAEVQKRAEALARKLEGLVLTITFDAAMHKVTKVDGVKEYVKRAFGDDFTDPGRFEESITEEQQDIFCGFLPDKPVAAGATWQRKSSHRSPQAAANFTALGDFTYKGKDTVAGKTAERIDAVWRLTFAPPKVEGDPAVEVEGDLKADTAKATYYFDADAGRLVQSDRSLRVKGTVTISSKDKKLSYDLDQDQTWRVRLLRENLLGK